MIAIDRHYVSAPHRLLALQTRRTPFLEQAREARDVRDAERVILASGEDADYLHHLTQVAEGGSAFFAPRPRVAP